MLMSDPPATSVLLCLSHERTDGDSQISLVRSGNLHGRLCAATGTVGTESFLHSFPPVYWICTLKKKAKTKQKQHSGNFDIEENMIHLWKNKLMLGFFLDQKMSFS